MTLSGIEAKIEADCKCEERSSHNIVASGTDDLNKNFR